MLFCCFVDGEKSSFEALLEKTSPPIRVGRTSFILSTESSGHLFIKIPNENHATNFQIQVIKALKGHETSIFAERTEDSSALQYFQVRGHDQEQEK